MDVQKQAADGIGKEIHLEGETLLASTDENKLLINMNDQYPFHVPIEIDRTQVRRYLRTTWLLAWTLMLSGFGTFFGIASVSKNAEASQSLMEGTGIFAMGAGCGAGLGLILGGVLYVVFSHRLAGRAADGLEVSVEGAFLRVRQLKFVATDRKLHFRSIVDYTVVRSDMMRQFGIEALQLTTIAGGQNAALTIPGVKDCMRIRDMLSEIDRLREGA